MEQQSANFEFWEIAFKNKNVSIYDLAKMTGVNGEISKDEFREITGMDFLPNVINNKVDFIATSEIINELAKNKISNMQKDNLISGLTNQIAKSRINDMQKDKKLTNLTQQVASTKLEIMKIKNKEKVGN